MTQQHSICIQVNPDKLAFRPIKNLVNPGPTTYSTLIRSNNFFELSMAAARRSNLK